VHSLKTLLSIQIHVCVRDSSRLSDKSCMCPKKKGQAMCQGRAVALFRNERVIPNMGSSQAPKGPCIRF